MDMAELKQETWLFDDQAADKSVISLFRRRKEPVSDILVWVQCYATMVAFLSEKYPQHVPHLMWYLVDIVRSSKLYSGLGWVAYDSAYRRRALKQGDLKWSQGDQSLYQMWFTGRAKEVIRCTHCMGEHDSVRCPQEAGALGQLFSATIPQMGPPQVALTPQHDYLSTAPIQQKSREVCGQFNAIRGPKCTFNPCRYMHLCSNCLGNHPRAYCSAPGKGKGKHPGWPSFQAPNTKKPHL